MSASPPAISLVSYRPHIDGLRAVAVLSVILNHFNHKLLPSGFLGVDIFFVISGYVVTSSLLEKRHETWKDYLIGFYVRRFKRLVPALSVSILFTCMMTLLLISPADHVLKSGATALIGMSNMYFLAHSTDYFATAAVLNPFTHTWSLGVEEQFYFGFPLLLGLCGYCVGRSAHAKRNLILAVTGIGSLSLTGFLYLALVNPSAAFFLMPVRFWEFGAGCLIYVTSDTTSNDGAEITRWSKVLSLLALGSILGILYMPKSTHPFSVPLIVAVTSAAIRFMDKATPAAVLMSAKPLVSIGLASYSLYLWHWPFLSLSRYVFGGSPTSTTVLVIPIAFLSWASFRFIEKPLRKKMWSSSEPRAVAFGICGAFSAFILFGVAMPKFIPENGTPLAKIMRVPGPPQESFAFLGNCYKRDAATYSSRLQTCLTASRTDSTPNAFYLLGDSHAQKMARLIHESVKGSPFEPRFLIADLDSDFPYERSQRVKTTTNLEKVLRDSRPGDILALTFHRGHLNQERDVHQGEREHAGTNKKFETMRQNLDPYIRKFTGKGVRILFIRDVPLLGSITTVETCMMQEILLGSSSLCRVRLEDDMHTRSRQDLLFNVFVRSYPGVFVWDPAVFMYKEGNFNAYDEQRRYLMIDWHHISQYQESLLIKPFKEFLVQSVHSAVRPDEN